MPDKNFSMQIADEIEFDALIIGSGSRAIDGSVMIGSAFELHNIDPAFIEEYASVAKHDVVGQLFAVYPNTVQVIAVEKYRSLTVDIETGSTSGVNSGRRIADYLQRYGIHHFLLTGLESSYGLAWATIYRKKAEKPFSADDAEKAKYKIPAILYCWQIQHVKHREYLKAPATLLPLTVKEMQMTVLKANGLLAKDISDQLGLETSTVEDTLKKIRKRLKIFGRKLSPEDIQNYRDIL